jgi:N-acetylneuraminic acid mutarotase
MRTEKIFLWLIVPALLALSSCEQYEVTMNGQIWQWDQLPKLPDTIGVAGPFVGVSNDALIVAGGANFPYGPPWQDGEKVWHDDIYVLERGTNRWITGLKLDYPIAYGASIETEQGLVIAGGCDQQKSYADVRLLNWDAVNKMVTAEKLPSLPRPTSFCTGDAIGSIVYVVAAQSNADPRTAEALFWKLDLSKPALQRKWTSVDPWPGLPRNKAVIVAQKQIDKEYLYLFGGEYSTSDPHGQINRTYLRDVYRFNPAAADNESAWKRLSDLPKPLAASQAVSVSDSTILLISGSSGINVYKPVDIRPLFSTDVMAYDTVEDKFSYAGNMPLGVVTTNATIFDGSIVVPSGEIRPGIRTPLVQRLGAR